MAQDFEFIGHWLIELGEGDDDNVFRVWSGTGQLRFAGEDWMGVTSDIDGTMIADIGASEVKEGVPGTRLRVQVSAADTDLRALLLQDHGPLRVKVIWIVSTDDGGNWTVIRSYTGKLSGTSIDQDQIWTGELETSAGSSVDRGRPLYWSHESYQERYPGDRSFEQMRLIANSLTDLRFPN